MSRAPARLDYQLTIAETAERLHVSTKTIRRWISEGRLKAYRYGPGRVIRIDESDLLKLRRPVTNLAEVVGR